MKAENDTTQTPSTPQQPNPYATQWGTSHIPIDPALQQQPQHPTTTPYQHYQTYATHYPQAGYPHYQQYAPQQASTAAQSQTQTQTQPATASRQNNSAQPNNGIDTADIATLNDALGSAGVDLRAEEESLQRSFDHHQTYRPYEDRTRKQPLKPSFDTRFIGTTMRSIGTQHKITKIPDDSVNYLALALRARLQDLITGMIAASHHRTDTQFDRPASLYEDGTSMWSLVVRSDVAKQLAALEKVEREEEVRVRRERKERSEMAAAHAAALAAQAAGSGGAVAADGGFDDGDAGGAKKKRKKEGPGVTARNMSEDVRKKMSNAATPKAKTAASTSTPGASTSATVTTPATTTAPAPTPGGGASSWARPYVKTQKSSSASGQVPEDDTRTTVTMRDAIFVIEKERGHGGGRGAARGWI